jgi:hypothetical protein
MSDHDKMLAFGSWLTSKRLQLLSELYSLSINRDSPVDAIRIKAGHIECITQVLEVFKELYNGDLNKFMEEYLGQKPEEEDDKESIDGPSQRSP